MLRINIITTFITLFSVFMLSAQNVGINTNTPEKTLHVKGQLKIDSTAHFKDALFTDSMDDLRIKLDPDSGKLQFWDNDTMWYEIAVNSPPSETRRGSSFALEDNCDPPGFGDDTYTRTVFDEDGNIVRQTTHKVPDDFDSDDPTPMITEEIIKDGVVIQRSTTFGTISTKKEVFDDDGTPCMTEETVNNNSTFSATGGNVDPWVHEIIVTDHKNGDKETRKRVGLRENGSGVMVPSQGFVGINGSGVTMGGQTTETDGNATSMRIYNHDGEEGKGLRLIVNDQPGIVIKDIEIESTPILQKVSFCNTKEWEQKIDNAFIKKGIIDNPLGLYTYQYILPASSLSSIYSPSAGTVSFSSSLSTVSSIFGFQASSSYLRFSDASNNFFQSIYSPTGNSCNTSCNNSSVTSTEIYLPNAYHMEAKHTDNSFIYYTMQPLSGRFQLFSSQSTCYYYQDFISNSTRNTYRDNITNQRIDITFNPNLATKESSANGDMVHLFHWDESDKSTTSTIEDNSSFKTFETKIKPSTGTETKSLGGNLRFEFKMDEIDSKYSENFQDGAKDFEVEVELGVDFSGLSMNNSKDLKQIETFDNNSNVYQCALEYDDGMSPSSITTIKDPINSTLLHHNSNPIMTATFFDAPNNQMIYQTIEDDGMNPPKVIETVDNHNNNKKTIQSNQPNFEMQCIGDFDILGNLSKLSGSFKIDHPEDPYNKYLVHSFVESPDMMNVYNGNVTTDKEGFATVDLPSYYDALNMDPRYQLTVIGTFAQAIIKSEVNNNQFVIQTSEPNVKVSWQVTGIRNDKYARENRLVPVEEKKGNERGTLLYSGKVEKIN